MSCSSPPYGDGRGLCVAEDALGSARVCVRAGGPSRSAEQAGPHEVISACSAFAETHITCAARRGSSCRVSEVCGSTRLPPSAPPPARAQRGLGRCKSATEKSGRVVSGGVSGGGGASDTPLGPPRPRAEAPRAARPRSSAGQRGNAEQPGRVTGAKPVNGDDNAWERYGARLRVHSRCQRTWWHRAATTALTGVEQAHRCDRSGWPWQRRT